jgi:hypothetical protein
MDNSKIVLFCWLNVVVFLVSIVLLFFWVRPIYNVWAQGKAGEATLRKAESEKMVLIETAKAELEASRLRAEAIEIVGAAAKAYPEFRQQEFIAAFGEALQSGEVKQIIYVPTEANIPIVEAGRAVLGGPHF